MASPIRYIVVCEYFPGRIPGRGRARRVTLSMSYPKLTLVTLVTLLLQKPKDTDTIRVECPNKVGYVG